MKNVRANTITCIAIKYEGRPVGSPRKFTPNTDNALAVVTINIGMETSMAHTIMQSIVRNSAIKISPQCRIPALYDLKIISFSVHSGSIRYFIIP